MVSNKRYCARVKRSYTESYTYDEKMDEELVGEDRCVFIRSVEIVEERVRDFYSLRIREKEIC